MTSQTSSGMPRRHLSVAYAWFLDKWTSCPPYSSNLSKFTLSFVWRERQDNSLCLLEGKSAGRGLIPTSHHVQSVQSWIGLEVLPLLHSQISTSHQTQCEQLKTYWKSLSAENYILEYMLSSLNKFKYNTNFIESFKHTQRSHCNIFFLVSITLQQIIYTYTDVSQNSDLQKICM